MSQYLAAIPAAISAILIWVSNHQAVLIPLAVLIVADLRTSLTAYPTAETFLNLLADLLSFHAHSDSPQTLKLPGQRSKPPLVLGQKLTSSTKTPKPTGGYITLFALALLLARPARADLVVSHGPSIPFLEYTGGTHPVSFAKGFGYQFALGFGQFALLNQSWDAIDISGVAFGSAVTGTDGAVAGTLQVGLMVGTLNNLISIGAAVPLLDGNVGAFQGSFKVYPLLSFNIPISFEPLSPPVEYTPGPAGLPRGGTVYLGGGNRQ